MTEPTVLYEERGAVAIDHAEPTSGAQQLHRQMHRELWAALDTWRPIRRCGPSS
jgi:hypothetical protein